METDGTYEPSDTRGAGVPRPATPPEAPVPPPVHPPVPSAPPAPSAAPPVPSAPPKPVGAPGASGVPVSRVAAWLDAPRPEAGVGIWRYRHEEVEEAPERLAPVTVAGMLIPLVVLLLAWSAWNSNSFPYQGELLWALTPRDWWYPGSLSPVDWHGEAARAIYDGVIFFVLVGMMAFLGSWSTVVRHYLNRFRPRMRGAITVVMAIGALALVWPDTFGLGWDPVPLVKAVLLLAALLTGSLDLFTSPFAVYTLYTLITLLVLWPFARLGDWWGLLRAHRARKTPVVPSTPTGPVVPPSQWPALRAAGEQRAADVLAAEVAEGRMNDVDCARVNRAWRDSERDQVRRAALVGKLLRDGAAAGAHPSGERDLPGRAATHDLLLGQVRVGRYADGERTPHPYRRAGLALDPGLLGTSLLAVGPSGSGKTRALVAPVVESLTLQALAGAGSVVAVAGAGAPLGPDTAYDVVIRLGDPASAHDLDLYAGATDPDEAAAFLAEGLVGDMPGVETRRAATVLAQLVGPYRAAYGRFPTVPVLRELLEARPETLRTLHDLLPEDGAPTMRRELDSRIRQVGTATDLGPVLADRLAALDRPAFAEFFGTGGVTDKGDSSRPFSLRAVAQHPVRVRICLPDDGAHEEAARLLNRLLLAQFQTVVRDRSPRGHFACLVLDDAAGALTPGTVRGLQRLRPQNAGAVLALRTLAEVPAELHGPLLAGVGCRMALAGIPNWDGRAFAEAWGTERVETTEVAHHTVFADQPMTRALHALRKLMTGKAVTTEAVTVREVERERWSASELAHEVPPGHAVLSLTHVRGEHTPPLLVDLRS
ncbi:ATP/GTP-binding protein [Streptomyces fradiae]|uniref:ATP/GTP-binding protein n=1 Tax=Streptomyces fradiae TaxID=1906 RepID=UPI003518FC3F